jgi:hypothetical protein
MNGITDKLPHPMPALLPKPAPKASYIDPVFGTKITRISVTDPADGDDAIIKPMYSTMPAWNANEEFLLLWSRKHGHLIYEGDAPYRLMAYLQPWHPTDIEQILWDPIDPNVLYYPTNYNALPLLVKQTMRPWEARIIHDFRTPPTNCVPSWGKLLKLGSDPQWMGYGGTAPRKIVGLQCGEKKFLYSITEDKVLVVGPANTPNAPIVGPSETRAVLDGHVLDIGLHNLGLLPMANPGEHASMGMDGNEHDRWNAVAFDGSSPISPVGSLVSWDLVTKQPKVVVGPDTGWPFPGSGTHLSAVGQRAPGWVAVGTVGGMPWGQGVLQNEIILANVDTGEVYRVAHARTRAGADCGPRGDQCKWGYWGETHPVISPSGTRIVFGSDWMGSDSVDSYVIDLRP